MDEFKNPILKVLDVLYLIDTNQSDDGAKGLGNFGTVSQKPIRQIQDIIEVDHLEPAQFGFM